MALDYLKKWDYFDLETSEFDELRPYNLIFFFFFLLDGDYFINSNGMILFWLGIIKKIDDFQLKNQDFDLKTKDFDELRP